MDLYLMQAALTSSTFSSLLPSQSALVDLLLSYAHPSHNTMALLLLLLRLDRITTTPTPPPVEVMPSPSPTWDSKISPSVLLIIAILAIIFFLSGLLHLLIRYLLTPPPPSTPTFPHHDPSSFDATALQGQLQQLFHLHDAGVDQSFIDALPIFLYRSITGAHKKDPFDCAVCLCEFDPEDKLRLLPKCSHAFHLHCIDTWLLSHSTCPLCRRSLLPPSSDCDSPAVVSHMGSLENDPFYLDPPESTSSKDQSEAPPPPPPPQEEKVVAVKLGKYRTTTIEEGSNSATIDNRRCFSMGSFEYVMDESSLLKVAIKPPEEKKKKKKKKKQGAGGGRRMAMSEWDCESQREAKAGKESMSVSKTWLRGCGKEEAVVEGGSRRVVSFRRTEKDMCVDEADVGNEMGCDVESCCDSTTTTTSSWNGSEVVRRGEEMPSFARRTMLWVMGRNHLLSNTSSRVGDLMV